MKNNKKELVKGSFKMFLKRYNKFQNDQIQIQNFIIITEKHRLRNFHFIFSTLMKKLLFLLSQSGTRVETLNLLRKERIKINNPLKSFVKKKQYSLIIIDKN